MLEQILHGLHPESGKDQSAFHEVLIAGAVSEAAALAFFAIAAHLHSLEEHAKKQGNTVVAQYDQDTTDIVTYPLRENPITTSLAAFDGLKYQNSLLEKTPPQYKTAAIALLDKADSSKALKSEIAQIAESDTLLRLGDEITDSAEDLAGESPLVTAGKSIHKQVIEGTPLSEHHVKTLLGSLSTLTKFMPVLSGTIHLIEMPIKTVVHALHDSTARLQTIIAARLSEKISYDPAKDLSTEQLVAKLQSMSTDIEIEDRENFDWEQLATALTAEFVLRNANEIAGKDAEGKSTASPEYQRLSTAVQMIGSLDVHQKARSSQSAPSDETSRR